MTGTGDLVENYLDQLYVGLRGSPRQGRRILAEAEDHLREGVADGVAAGLTEREAQEQAISSFGSVRAVVRAHDRRLRTVPGLAVLADVAMSGWRLGSIGLLAVGASGLVAAVMNLAFGRSFVGSASGAALPLAACRHWLSNWPGAHSCAQAYLLESSSDAVSLRVFTGLIGLTLLGGLLPRPPERLVARGAAGCLRADHRDEPVRCGRSRPARALPQPCQRAGAPHHRSWFLPERRRGRAGHGGRVRRPGAAHSAPARPALAEVAHRSQQVAG